MNGTRDELSDREVKHSSQQVVIVKHHVRDLNMALGALPQLILSTYIKFML